MPMNRVFPAMGLLAGGLLSVSATAWAATPLTPAGVLEQLRQTREDLRRLQELEEPEERRAPAEVIENQLPQEEAGGGGNGRRFVLREVRLDPSRILDPKKLEAVRDRYLGKEVSISDLFRLRDEINKLYLDAGAPAARAVLPPQRIRNGAITIRLVEGRIGHLILSGNASTDADYIRGGLETKEGELVLLDRLERDLMYFNAVNDIELRAVLKPGETFGTTDFEIRVAEPQRREMNVFADNAGREDIGLYRTGFTFTDRSLSGRRDAFTLGGQVADGTRALNAAYSLPLGSRGTRIGLSADYSHIDIVDGQLEPLNVSGSSRNLGIALTRPLAVDRNSLVNGFVALNAKKSDTAFDRTTLFESRVRTLALGADWRADMPGSVSYARVQVTASRTGWSSDKGFNRANFDYSRAQAFSGGRTLLLRARGQWSDTDLLPSSEQFQIGGMTSVRGYPEGLLSGDSGYLLSLELSLPFPDTNPAVGPDPLSRHLRGLVFLDHGGAFPFKGNGKSIDEQDFITSVGAGVNMDLRHGMQGRLMLGIPIDTRDDGEDSPSLHFHLQKSLL